MTGDGLLAHTGLHLEPDSTQPLKVGNRGFGFDAERLPSE
jgi:hypothetical protein